MTPFHLMGSDHRIVRAARVSFAKDDLVDRERDIKLLRYLYQNKHASPFEHVIIALPSSREEYFQWVEKITLPTCLVYYAEGYTWLNLRTTINIWELIPEEVKEGLRASLPATISIVEGTEVRGYTVDEQKVMWREDTSSGWIGLVDKLELGTCMDHYTFVVECPLFVARQWMRHRFGSFNEVSRRYVSYEPSFYIPKYLRPQAKDNKQASEDIPMPESAHFLKEWDRIVKGTVELYNKMIERGVAKELARGVLPQTMKTRFYWTVPRISLDNFISLRDSPHAQKEIREFAAIIKERVGYRGTDRRMRL